MKLNEIDENLEQLTENKWLAKLIQAVNLGRNIQRIAKNPKNAAYDAVTRGLDNARDPSNPYVKGDQGFMGQYKKKKKRK